MLPGVFSVLAAGAECQDATAASSPSGGSHPAGLPTSRAPQCQRLRPRGEWAGVGLAQSRQTPSIACSRAACLCTRGGGEDIKKSGPSRSVGPQNLAWAASLVGWFVSLDCFSTVDVVPWTTFFNRTSLSHSNDTRLRLGLGLWTHGEGGCEGPLMPSGGQPGMSRLCSRTVNTSQYHTCQVSVRISRLTCSWFSTGTFLLEAWCDFHSRARSCCFGREAERRSLPGRSRPALLAC